MLLMFWGGERVLDVKGENISMDIRHVASEIAQLRIQYENLERKLCIETQWQRRDTSISPEAVIATLFAQKHS